MIIVLAMLAAEPADLRTLALEKTGKWYYCVETKAASWAGQNASPSDLADAAMGDCQQEAAIAELAERDYFRSTMSTGVFLRVIDDHLARERQDCRQGAMAAVVKARARAANAAAPQSR